MSATEPSQTRSPVVDIERLFQEYSAPVYRCCLARLGSREEAEDAVQLTFLNAWRSLRRGTQPAEPRAWLFTIAVNVSTTLLRNRLRGAKVEVRAPEAFEQMPSDAVPDVELVDLDAALHALPVRQRQALLLRDWRGLSYAEIATELDASEPAVETLLFRARRAVAGSLTKPTRRIRRAPLRSTLSGLIPWPSALSGLKSSLAGSATAKAVAVAVGATAPLFAFGILERTLTNRDVSHARSAPAAEAEVRFEHPQEASRSLPASFESTRRRTAAPAAHEPPRPKTGRRATQTRSAGAGGAAPVSLPTGSTQPSPPPSTSSDPPVQKADEGAALVVICHLTGSKKNPDVTISVAASAVDAHLAQGDQLGACAS